MTLQEQLCVSLRANLTENILPFWLNRMADPAGGFFGRMDGNNRLHPAAPRGAILNARILWSFSAAYRQLRDPQYLAAATSAYEYLRDHFIDREEGGVYWSVGADGTPLDTKKQSYAIGFAIYGLSEYVRATSSPEALALARELFGVLEKNARDEASRGGGYIEAFNRDWSEISDMRLSEKDANEKKTMNTHLHILEPYTNLYRVWPAPELKEAIIDLLRIFLDVMLDRRTFHLGLFFDENWVRHDGNISYGHDIEGTWLMMETAEVLGEKDMLEKAEPRCLDMAAACLEQAILPDGSMIYEYDPATRHINTNRSWWVQAETVVGFLNAWQLSGQQRFLDASLECFKYIDTFLVDHEYGEWFTMLGNSGEVLPGQHAKIDGWKCPYHNARMCFEIIERYEKA